MMRSLLANLGRRPARESGVAPQTVGQETVFIIDDNPDRLRATSAALAHETYRVQSADSVESAIGKLRSLRPVLILLDSEIIDANGSPLARRLLADEQLASIPIVVLSEASAAEHGNPETTGRFDGYIPKPVEVEKLAGQVRAFLSSVREPPPHPRADVRFSITSTSDRRRQAADLLSSIEAGLPDSQFASGTQKGLHQLAACVAGLQHYDLADHLERAEQLAGATTARARSRFASVIRWCRELADRDPVAMPGIDDLRAGYLDHRREELANLDHAVRIGDWASLRKAGHNLKGTGAAYGFAELTDIGRALDAAAKQGDRTAIETLLDRIDAYIGIVQTSRKYRSEHATGN